MGVSKLVCSHLQLRHLMLLSQTEEPEVYPLSTAILEAEAENFSVSVSVDQRSMMFIAPVAKVMAAKNSTQFGSLPSVRCQVKRQCVAMSVKRLRTMENNQLQSIQLKKND